MSTIDIQELLMGNICAASNWVGNCHDSAVICLEEQGHSVGVSFKVAGTKSVDFQLKWSSLNQAVKPHYYDDEAATEHGAYGIAILLQHKISNYGFLGRSKKGKGFDLYFAPMENAQVATEDQNWLASATDCTEVSGIREGDGATIRRRMLIKSKQVSNAPGITRHVVIVCFQQPAATLKLVV